MDEFIKQYLEELIREIKGKTPTLDELKDILYEQKRIIHEDYIEIENPNTPLPARYRNAGLGLEDAKLANCALDLIVSGALDELETPPNEPDPPEFFDMAPVRDQIEKYLNNVEPQIINGHPTYNSGELWDEYMEFREYRRKIRREHNPMSPEQEEHLLKEELYFFEDMKEKGQYLIEDKGITKDEFHDAMNRGSNETQQQIENAQYRQTEAGREQTKEENKVEEVLEFLEKNGGDADCRTSLNNEETEMPFNVRNFSPIKPC